jgi:hypothetical protein
LTIERDRIEDVRQEGGSCGGGREKLVERAYLVRVGSDERTQVLGVQLEHIGKISGIKGRV